MLNFHNKFPGIFESILSTIIRIFKGHLRTFWCFGQKHDSEAQIMTTLRLPISIPILWYLWLWDCDDSCSISMNKFKEFWMTMQGLKWYFLKEQSIEESLLQSIIFKFLLFVLKLLLSTCIFSGRFYAYLRPISHFSRHFFKCPWPRNFKLLPALFKEFKDLREPLWKLMPCLFKKTRNFVAGTKSFAFQISWILNYKKN